MRTVKTFNPNPEISCTIITDNNSIVGSHIIDEHHVRPFFVSGFDGYEELPAQDGHVIAFKFRHDGGFHVATYPATF